MQGSLRFLASLAAITAAVVYGLFTFTVAPSWAAVLLTIGAAAALRGFALGRGAAAGPERMALTAALLFPAYVAFQLVPLPLFLVRLISPARAGIAAALGHVLPAPSFAPLSIAPATTWLHLGRIAGYVLLFLLVRECARQSPRWAWITASPLIVIAILEAVLGLYQRTAGEDAAHGTYLSKDHFAGLIEMILPFVALYAVVVLARIYEAGEWNFGSLAYGARGLAMLAAAASVFYAIVLSLSRMGFISTLGSIFVMGALSLRLLVTGRRRWLAVGAMGLFSVYLFLFLPPQEFVEELGKLASDTTVHSGRWPIWKDTVRLILDFPLFGCGMGAYFPGFLRYQTSQLNLAWTQAHNDYLQLLSELGIAGFLLPATVMLALFVKSARAVASRTILEVRLLGLACAGGMAAILIHSFADFNLYMQPNAMILWWIGGIAAGLPELRRKAANSSRKWPDLPPRAAFLLAALLIFHSGASLVFHGYFKTQPQAERVFCAFGICDTNGALAARQRELGGAALAASELLPYLPRDAAGPHRWADLGEALHNAGRTDEARYCFSRVLALGPNLPYMLFRTAMFHFSLQERKRALELMARALEGDSNYETTAFSVYDGQKAAIGDVLRYGLIGRRSFESYFRFLLASDRAADAAAAWRAMAARFEPGEQLTVDYIYFLFKRASHAQAAEAWAAFLRGAGKSAADGESVFDGGFEADRTQSPFDWRLQGAAAMAVAADDSAARSGRRSLRISFNGTANETFRPASQYVFLKPGRYRLSAYMRTEGVSGEEGVRLRLQDRDPLPTVASSETLTGTNDWRRVEVVFDAPPQPVLLDLQLFRQKARFNHIQGTVWVDEVSIKSSPDSITSK